MSGPTAKRTEATSKHARRRQAFRFSLAIAIPLALVMAATYIGLSATTPERGLTVRTESPHQTAPPRQPEVTAEASAMPEPAAGNAPSEQRAAHALPTPSSAVDQDSGFALDDIANALSQINLDENGDILADGQARAVLEAAFLQPDRAMDEARFSRLKTLVEGGLQGEAGHQAAAMAERFYRYSNAYREVEDTFGYHGELHNLEADFKQLSRMRHTYLGEELSDALYGEEEALMRYTLQSMRIQADENLSTEQKQARQEQLREQVPTSLIGAPEQASTP